MGWRGSILWGKLARMEVVPAMLPRPAPNPYRRTGSSGAVTWLHNGVEVGDMTLEHEPPLSFREATTRSSLGTDGVFLQNHRLADGS
jgi:hypothetical protein